MSDSSNQAYIKTLQQEHGTFVDGKLNTREREGIWTDAQVRDDTFRKVLPQLSGQINDMLATGGKQITETLHLDEPIGIALDDSDPFVRSSNMVTFVIRAASNMPEGFTVLTAYPKYDSALPVYIPAP
jgi:hypothetical protein